jgi:hypothetical protein
VRARVKPGDRIVVIEAPGAPSALVGHRATVGSVDSQGIFVRFSGGLDDYLFIGDFRPLDAVERLAELA